MTLFRLLVALALTGVVSPAFAQYCSQSNNPYCNEEEARRKDELERERRDQERRDEYSREAESAEEWRRSQAGRQEAADQDAQALADNAAMLQQMRTQLLKTPALQANRNVLLGRWRVAGSDKPRPKDDWAELASLLTNPGGAMCTVLFGEGITEFLPATWASIDSYGNDSLGRIQYRMHNGSVYALPDQGIPLLGFEVVDKNRIREVRMPSCVLERVAAQAAAVPVPQAVGPATAYKIQAGKSGAGSAPQGTKPAAATQSAQAGTNAATPPASVRPAGEPIDPNSPLGRGVRLHAEKDFQPALRELLIAEKATPNDPRVLAYLADTYNWLGMSAEASRIAVRAKQLDPNAFDVLN